MLTINFDSPVSLTAQITDGVRRAIAVGELAAGTVLPPVRQLAADLGVNLNTVARAYRALEERGLVVTRRGRGTSVAATTETARPKREVVKDVSAKLRPLLSDARLAGLGADQVRELVEREMKLVWKRG
ncbi:MAG: GntR family transcriptional regulator [Planctomycetota bacterium]